MSNSNGKKKIENICIAVILAALCAVIVLLGVLDIQYTPDKRKNIWIGGCIEQLCGVFAVILLMCRLGIKAFGKIRGWLYLLPCLLIAVDNFPFVSYFQGNMRFIEYTAIDFLLFAFYCLLVGIFEECVFRGIFFSVFAGHFTNDKKGFIKTYVCSSLVFGGAHLFNLFSDAGLGETLLQVVYTVLTGGLFAFAFIKTQNVLCAAFVHGVYNFCGLLLSEQGLGSGVIFDLGTVLTMLVVSVAVGAFVLYSVWKHPEIQRKELYKRLGIENTPNIQQITPALKQEP